MEVNPLLFFFGWNMYYYFCMRNSEILEKKVFVVVGDTVNPDKYAYKIKQALLQDGYTVYCVGKELESLNDVPCTFDVLDLCIHPKKGMALLQDAVVDIPFVLIQPGAGDDEIYSYLSSKSIEWQDGCILKALQER